jgi:Arsenical resistance operon protein ArsD
MKVQVFDPAMCCSTGVCGPGVDPQLARIAADLEWLKSKGVEVERYNLAQDVAAFTANATVKQALNSQGTKCLPMMLVDGRAISQGNYPTREELAEMTGVAHESGPVIKPRNPELVGIGLGSLETKK